jgi:hypothetical protein
MKAALVIIFMFVNFLLFLKRTFIIHQNKRYIKLNLIISLITILIFQYCIRRIGQVRVMIV